jgi:large-conductance mechanosensitive channel
MANWNNQTATGAEKGVGRWLSGFKAFILRGNAVGLALGIVIGAAFIAIVNAFVSDVITSLIPVSNSNIEKIEVLNMSPDTSEMFPPPKMQSEVSEESEE